MGGEVNSGDWSFMSGRLRTTEALACPPFPVETIVPLSPADDGVLDVSDVLRVQVRGLHLEDAGPGLGVDVDSHRVQT